jgi:response regulator RpfG family c-di-GMP phosphodiesterase
VTSTTTAVFTPPPKTSGTEGARILLVDDEPALLSSMRRQLASRFRVETETDPIAALDRIDDIAGLAVIVSDMRMPGMDGATFLGRVCDRWPDITRILLTGFAEVDSAIAAVNQGRIFRFLSKPITPDEFKACLDDAVRQYQLVCAERELLEQTLRGSVKALVETLSMANPTAFARATRIGSRVVSLAEHVKAPNQWEIEVAGMLSHIGTVVLPPGINERLQSGQELSLSQQEYVAELPAIAVSVLAEIPRLDSVRRIIAFQRQRYDGRGPVASDVGGEDIPLGARILRAATDYDALEARGTTANRALRAMRNTDGQYDPAVLEALEAVLSIDSEREMAYVKLAELHPGMVLAADLRTSDNTLLVSRGQELTARTIMRIKTWSDHTSIAEPVAVYVQAADSS